VGTREPDGCGASCPQSFDYGQSPGKDRLVTARRPRVSKAALTAIYVTQALFWVWLAREAVHDRPRAGTQRRSTRWPFLLDAERLWCYDASVIVSFSVTLLILSTIVFIIALLA
jgi:hypothetical protein